MEENQSIVSRENVVSFGEWIGTFLLLMIPIVNIILLFVWAFGSNTKLSKANFAKASLFLSAICIVLYLIIAFVFVGIFNGILNM